MKKCFGKFLFHLFIVLTLNICHNSRDIHTSFEGRVEEFGHEDIVTLISKKISNGLMSTTLDSEDILDDQETLFS